MQILVHIGLLYFIKKNEIIYFYSFMVEYIPEEIKNFYFLEIEIQKLIFFGYKQIIQ